MNPLKYAIKAVLFETPLARFIGPRYTFNFEPAQLAFLCECLTATAAVPGCVVEAGCFAGQTTVFLNAHMSAEGMEKPYHALDTFGGFVKSQAEHEVSARVKSDPFQGFAMNSQRWFDRTMQVNGIRRVQSTKADVAEFDFAKLAPIAFCLLDVDLYLPTKAAIPGILSVLAPGGILVVDDCKPDNIYDGAYQAFIEFGGTEIRHGKLGVIRR
jgi:SAM-dependent methyltransferase